MSAKRGHGTGALYTREDVPRVVVNGGLQTVRTVLRA